MTAWAESYIGIPYVERGRDERGVDCFGLVKLILEREFGIALPEQTYKRANRADGGKLWAAKRDAHAKLVDGERKPGDIVLLRVKGLAMHAGVLIDSERFLHVMPDGTSCIESLNGLRWCCAVEGVWRCN